MLSAALSYIAHDWSIIPLKPRGKLPLLPSWAEYQTRLATEEEIREWFTRWPDANLAIVTGCVSGLVVLDLDGPAAVQAARERGGLPPSPCVVTKRGYHYYLACPGQPVKNAAALGGVKGLDVRGDGGYAVAPPSVHPSGRCYAWAKGRSPDDLPLAPCPEWLLELLENQNQVAASKEPDNNKEPGWVETLLRGVPEGQRDDVATRLAGHFLGKGLPESEVLALLLTWNQRNQPPLPEKDVEKCVRSVANREARKPTRSGTQIFHTSGFRLDGPVYAPTQWRTLVICRNWQEARRLAAQGNAVVVTRKDGTLPPEAGKLVAIAKDVKTAGFTPEEARRLAWELYPLRLIRTAATEGTAALKPELAEQAQAAESVAELTVPEPETELKSGQATEPEPAFELTTPANFPPDPAPPPAEPAISDPTANRFTLECWLNQHRPDLLAAIRTAEAEAERAWFYAEAGFPAKLAAAEAALARAVAEGQKAMRDALEAGREEPEEEKAGRELTFAEVEQAFGGFERVWQLNDAQAANLERIFQEKGPVVVQSPNRKWWSVEEWIAE